MDTPLGMSWGLASWAAGLLWLSHGLPGLLTLLCFHVTYSFLPQRARVGQGMCSGLNEVSPHSLQLVALFGELRKCGLGGGILLPAAGFVRASASCWQFKM